MSKKEYQKNKDFYEKYIKDDRTEDEKMMDIIHENARKERTRYNYHKNTKQRNKGDYERNRAISITQLIIILLLILILVAIWT